MKIRVSLAAVVLLAVALSCSIDFLRADTLVGGGLINQDTTWAAAQSPFIVSGTVTINPGATLTIEPGTSIYLDEAVNFGVAKGARLLAVGTATAPIRFGGIPGSSSKWGGFSIGGDIDSPESRFAFVHIESNGGIAIRSVGGTLMLDHVTFGASDRTYLSLDDSSFVLSHCEFPAPTGLVEPVHGNGGIKAGGRGIVQNCFFGGALGYNDVLDFTGGNRPGPIIQFYNNVFVGGSDDILDLDGTDAWIEGNIFLHVHKNGAPDSSSAVSGGDNGRDTSEITIIGNLFFDCDQAATAKEGDFFTMLNNTIVRMRKDGGMDTAAGVVNVRDLDPRPTSFGVGFYLEGNIIVDAEQLVRNYVADQTLVTFKNNILPMDWTGPGSGNIVADPRLKHIPELAETYFTNWTDAQILRDWFSLLPGSPGAGTGPNGRDQGGVIPFGVSISGEPGGTTEQSGATLIVGPVRTGHGISTTNWPNGSGYIAYKWRLDSGPWSAETAIEQPIVLTELTPGPHFVEVTGKRDSGFYQDDPLFGSNAVVTRSRTWVVQNSIRITSQSRQPAEFTLHFMARRGDTYSVQYTDSLDPATWIKLADVPAQSVTADFSVTDAGPTGRARFYRVRSPAQP